MRSPYILAALGAAVALSACDGQPPTGVELQHATDAATITPSASIVGEIGPGATYEIVVPPVWNGDLVLYAHGYVDPAGTEPLTPEEQALLPLLPAQGYALAWSSYSENGLAVKDGAQRTKQLRGIFAAEVGEPARTFLVGGSLGGLVALDLAERFPRHYDGALTLCGMVGGSQAQIDYVANVRVLFDALYPTVLPGGLFEGPVLTPTEVAALVGSAVAIDPVSLAVLASVMDATFGTPLPASDNAELVTSLITALTFDVRGFGDVRDRTHSHVPFDNTDVWYAGSPNDVALNAVVARYEERPDATNYLDNYYEPTGALRIPIVTLHNPLDPVVPAFHEALLASSAAAAGYGDALTQWPSATPYGHCAFDATEVMAAFGALVTMAP